MIVRAFSVMLVAVLATLAFASTAGAQAGIGPGSGSTYSQDFNSLASSGTSSSVPGGWAFSESGMNADSSYTADTGLSYAGDTYSYGASGNSERAFGELTSHNLQSTLGVQFQNNTGSTIGRLVISYVCEQWRLGSTGNVDRMDFQYSTDATSLTTGTWLDFNSLDCIGPVTTGTVGSLDGNTATNRTSLSSQTITGLSIANGATFWLRWSPFNMTNSDDGLAVDDFSLTAQGPNAVRLGELSASTPSSSLALLPVLGLLVAGGLIARRRRS